jgi:hypothetical protein
MRRNYNPSGLAREWQKERENYNLPRAGIVEKEENKDKSISR